jgi:hypothetical protein|tara:strand:- start:7716 stop:8243 length:528 start_codon:yes stop_codon:yes gene_type:complete
MDTGMLQARFSEHDPRLYNVNRDLAHNYKRILEVVAARLEDGSWVELDAHLKENGVTMDELGEACAAFCRYVASAATDKKSDMFDGLTKAGWFECEPLAQAAYLAVMGTVVAGMAHRGIREATLGDDGPALRVGDLTESGERCLAAMRVSKRKRRWLGFVARVKGAFNSLRGRSE